MNVDAGLAILSRMRVTTARNSFNSLRRHSSLKIVVILIFATALWVGLFFMFMDAFWFLDKDMVVDFKPLLVDVIFAVFFLSLLIMLMFSNAIIAYSSLFRSHETAFLYARPFPVSHIFTYKLSETLLFSSWAFLFLALPLIVAYGINGHAPWYYYPGATLFFGVFALLPAAAGGVATLLVARFFSRSPRRVMLTVGAIVLLLCIGWGIGLLRAYKFGTHQAGAAWMNNVLGRLTLSQNPFLPSYWLSRGIQGLAAGRGGLGEAIYRFMLLLSTALFVGMIGIQMARRWYMSAYHRVQCAARRAVGGGRGGRWFYRTLERSLVGMNPELRMLVVKDAKTFLRDPVQWSQVLIFFGLLGVYFLNMRHLQYDLESPLWKNFISLLNLIATSLTLSTFTSRFIFPLISLEGKRFWILGLLPIDRRNLLYSKFWFAFMGSFFISEGLMVVSDLMLRTSWPVILLHGITVLGICGGLSGLAVGIGALYPNLREDNPSKIVSGFGGTLNLVFSVFFVVLMVGLLAVPYHVTQMGRRVNNVEFLRAISVPGAIVAVLVAVIAISLPMHLGVRAFRRLEA